MTNFRICWRRRSLPSCTLCSRGAFLFLSRTRSSPAAGHWSACPDRL